MPTHMLINVEVITRAEYYEARKDEKKLVVDEPNRFVKRERMGQFTLYVTHDGVFYRGSLGKHAPDHVKNMKMETVETQTQVIFADPNLDMKRAS